MGNKETLLKFMSEQGYKRNSPDKNRPFNIIPSNNITMKGVDFPVLGMSNTGHIQKMYPGMDYEFDGDVVFEIPMKQQFGGDMKFWRPVLQKGGVKPLYLSSKDSINVMGQKHIDLEHVIGYPGGKPNPNASMTGPKGLNVVSNYVKNKGYGSAMNQAQINSWLYNAGFDFDKNEQTINPKKFILGEYYRKYTPYKKDDWDINWGWKKRQTISDLEAEKLYSETVSKLPEKEQQILINLAKDWFYKNRAGSTPNYGVNPDGSLKRDKYGAWSPDYQKVWAPFIINQYGFGNYNGVPTLNSKNEIDYNEYYRNQTVPKSMREDGGQFQVGGEENFNKVKDWYNDYIQSPLYRKNLEQSGYNKPDEVINQRLKNLNRTDYVVDENRSGSYYKNLNNKIYHSPESDVTIWSKEYTNIPESDDIIAHEFGHAVLDNSDNFIMLGGNQPYINRYDYKELELRNKNPKISRGVLENYADQKALQYEAAKLGIYNPGYEEFTKEHLDKIQSAHKNRALENYSEEDLIWLMNNIAQVDNQSSLPIAQKGKETKVLYVNDANDPRYRAYQDSISAYNNSINFKNKQLNYIQKQKQNQNLLDRMLFGNDIVKVKTKNAWNTYPGGIKPLTSYSFLTSGGEGEVELLGGYDVLKKPQRHVAIKNTPPPPPPPPAIKTQNSKLPKGVREVTQKEFDRINAKSPLVKVGKDDFYSNDAGDKVVIKKITFEPRQTQENINITPQGLVQTNTELIPNLNIIQQARIPKYFNVTDRVNQPFGGTETKYQFYPDQALPSISTQKYPDGTSMNIRQVVPVYQDGGDMYGNPISIAQKGGKPKTIYVDRDDPKGMERYRAFQDSLSTYNKQNAFNAKFLSNFKNPPKLGDDVNVDIIKAIKEGYANKDKIISAVKELPNRFTSTRKSSVVRSDDDTGFIKYKRDKGYFQIKPGHYIPNSVANKDSIADDIFSVVGIPKDTKSKKHGRIITKGKNEEIVREYTVNPDHGSIFEKAIKTAYGFPHINVINEKIKPIGYLKFHQNVDQSHKSGLNRDHLNPDSIMYDDLYYVNSDLPIYQKPREEVIIKDTPPPPPPPIIERPILETLKFTPPRIVQTNTELSPNFNIIQQAKTPKYFKVTDKVNQPFGATETNYQVYPDQDFPSMSTQTYPDGTPMNTRKVVPVYQFGGTMFKSPSMVDYEQPSDELINDDYNMERALELGYTPDETGHWPSVDYETGEWLKSKKHHTRGMELMAYELNPELHNAYNLIENEKGKMQYIPKAQVGGTWMGNKLNPQGYITSETKGGNRITFTGDQRADDWINKQIDSGKFGFDPKTGGTFPLKKSVKGLSKEDQMMATREYGELTKGSGFTTDEQESKIKSLPKEQQELINQANRNKREKYVAQNMQEAYQHPLMSPGLFTPEGAFIGAMQGFANMGPDLYEGNYLGAAGDAFMTLPVTGRYIGQGLKTAGKALGTESGLLSNTYKINPWAFKPNPEAYYRMLGETGVDDFMQSKIIRANQNLTGGAKYAEPYFSKGYPLDGRMYKGRNINGYYKGPGMVEVVNEPFNTSFPKSEYVATPINELQITNPNVKVYTQDWLRGYKEIKVPKKPSLDLEPVLGRYDHNPAVNKNLVYQLDDEGNAIPFNKETGKSLQDEYIEELQAYYDSDEFKRIMREEYPDVDVELYKKHTLDNLKNKLTYSKENVSADAIGTYYPSRSSDAVYIPGHTPTFKQKVNNANTISPAMTNTSPKSRKSFVTDMSATDHELSHQRTNSDELLPEYLTQDYLKQNIKPEFREEILNNPEHKFNTYYSKPTEFDVRLKQLKKDLKREGINDYFKTPVEEQHIDMLTQKHLRALQELEGDTAFKKFTTEYKQAKKNGATEKELEQIVDNFYAKSKEIDNKYIFKNISSDTEDLLKYFNPSFLAKEAKRLPAILPIGLATGATGAAILPTEKQGGLIKAQEGTIVPGGKNIKIQNADGTISTINTGSPEYREMYESGQIQNAANTDDNTFWAGVLDEVGIKGTLSEFAKERQKQKKLNSWEQFANERFLGNFEKNMGQTLENLPESRKQEYEDYIDKLAFDEYVRTHPQAKGESRGQYIDRLQKLNENVQSFDRAYDANAAYNDATDVNKWRKFLVGLGSVVLPKPAMNYLKQHSDYYSTEEKQDMRDNPISTHVEDVVGTLEPLTIPVEGLYGNKPFSDIASGQSANIPMSARILGDPLMPVFEAAPLLGTGLKTAGRLLGTEEGLLSNAWKLNSKTPTNIVENVAPAKWSMQEMPGLHLKSTITDGAISKIVEPKTGLINVEQALGIIGKESGGADKVALIRQSLGETLPKKMDYNEFRKVVQDQLIPLERQFSTQKSGYGLDAIGYNTTTINFDTGVKTITNKPLENQTLILSNKSKFGRGSSAHGNPDETLGHIHFLRDAETPDVLTVTQIQSDAFQGTHRIMPKNAPDPSKAQYSLQRMEEFQNRNKSILNRMKTEGVDEAGLPVQDYQIKQFEDIIKAQEQTNLFKKAELENFSQKSLLDKNHQERYLQELVNYAAERGDINKVRVPTSETAANVQGYISRKYWNVDIDKGDEVTLLDGTKGKITDDTFENLAEITTSDGQKVYVDFTMLGYRKSKTLPVKSVNNTELKEITSFMPEHQTILKKYSEQPKMIKKIFGQDARIVTDSKGNTWYEFDIPEAFKQGKGEIKAFKQGGVINNIAKKKAKHQNIYGWMTS